MSAIRAREAFVEVNGARLWTARQGRGPSLVLLHGGPGLWDDFDGLATMVDDVVEVHRYEQRGGGRSQRVGPYDLRTFVSDLEALRAYWGQDRWIVGGHSWGAALALAYAVEHPERVEAMLHLAGTGVIDDWHEEYHANAAARRSPDQRARHAELLAIAKERPEQFTPELDREYCVLAWLSDFADPECAEDLARKLLRPYGPNYDANAALSADWKRLLVDGSFAARVAGLNVPVLVLHGREDPRPLRLAERLAASLPNATLTVVEGAGHLPWLERSEETRAALRTFLAGITAAATAHTRR
jgi:proline iminopeptidase